MTAPSYRTWGLVLALLGVLTFSFRPILIKLAYTSDASAHPVSPTTLFFLRMVISLPFFLATAWWLRGSGARLTARDWAAVTGLGLLGYYVASFLDFLGLQYVGAGVGRLLLFLYPTMVLGLSWLFLRRRPTGRQVSALILTYAGVALVVSGQIGATPEGRLFLFGVLLVLASALFYAMYLVASSQIVQRVGSMRFTAYSMMAATVPAVLQFAALEGPASLDLPADVWLYALLIGTFCTVVPVFLQAEALRRIGATEFALVGAVSPVSVAVMSALGLGEPFGWPQVAGAALVIGGVLLVSLKRS